MSENGQRRPLPRPGREGPPHSRPRRVPSSLSRRREAAQLVLWLVIAMVLAYAAATILAHALGPAGGLPAGPAEGPQRPVERLAPACAETLQGCSSYSHGPADGTLAETASTH